jgi:hypothetical protein
MDGMKFIYQPDTVLTASELETVAVDLLGETPESFVKRFSKLLSIGSASKLSQTPLVALTPTITPSNNCTPSS